MPYFVVTTEAGPAWNPARPRRDQDHWKEHAAFIDGLAEAGFTVAVGPLAPTRALQIIEAHDEAEVRARLAKDPWMQDGTLRILSLDPWEVLVGKERLAPKGK
jgi:uncharacterized protein YciI